MSTTKITSYVPFSGESEQTGGLMDFLIHLKGSADFEKELQIANNKKELVPKLISNLPIVFEKGSDSGKNLWFLLEKKKKIDLYQQKNRQFGLFFFKAQLPFLTTKIKNLVQSLFFFVIKIQKSHRILCLFAIKSDQ